MLGSPTTRALVVVRTTTLLRPMLCGGHATSAIAITYQQQDETPLRRYRHRNNIADTRAADQVCDRLRSKCDADRIAFRCR